jgi:nicotinamidase-related amidase
LEQHRFIARREDSLVLVIDIQQAMLKIIDDWEKVAWKVSQITRAADIFNIPILVTEQYPKGLGPTIPQVLEAIRSPRVFHKEHFSACQEDGFVESIRSFGRSRIIVVGMETHVCVLQTALDLIQTGFEVQVVLDAVSSRSALNRDIGIELLRQAGAVITSTEIVLFGWIHRSNTEEFRLVHPILK